MSKPVKKIGRAIDKAFIRPLGDVGEKIDRTIGVKAQKDILSSGVKTLLQVPKIEQAQPSGSQVSRALIAPAAPLSDGQDDQMTSSSELYRRRRSRGMATGPAGLSTQANVQRKTLLGE